MSVGERTIQGPLDEFCARQGPMGRYLLCPVTMYGLMSQEKETTLYFLL